MFLPHSSIPLQSHRRHDNMSCTCLHYVIPLTFGISFHCMCTFVRLFVSVCVCSFCVRSDKKFVFHGVHEQVEFGPSEVRIQRHCPTVPLCSPLSHTPDFETIVEI